MKQKWKLPVILVFSLTLLIFLTASTGKHTFYVTLNRPTTNSIAHCNLSNVKLLNISGVTYGLTSQTQKSCTFSVTVPNGTKGKLYTNMTVSSTNRTNTFYTCWKKYDWATGDTIYISPNIFGKYKNISVSSWAPDPNNASNTGICKK